MNTNSMGLEQSTLSDERLELFIRQPLDNGLTRGEQMELAREAMARRKASKERVELTVWYGSMPESNGKENWTAMLHRKGEGKFFDGITIDRSEYPARVLYAADKVRYLLGEITERPSILNYDPDAHSNYAASPSVTNGP